MPKYNFHKVAKLRNHTSASGLQLYMKKEILSLVFSCEFYEIFKITFFCKTPQVAASESNFFAQIEIQRSLKYVEQRFTHTHTH